MSTTHQQSTRDEMARKVADHPGISATCPHCKVTATLTPDYIRGGDGRLEWTCGHCGSGCNAQEIESATAAVAGRKVQIPRRVTQL